MSRADGKLTEAVTSFLFGEALDQTEKTAVVSNITGVHGLAPVNEHGYVPAEYMPYNTGLQVSIGESSSTAADPGVAVGSFTSIFGPNGVAVGHGASSTFSSTAVGTRASAGNHGIAIGTFAGAGNNSTAIGYNSSNVNESYSFVWNSYGGQNRTADDGVYQSVDFIGTDPTLTATKPLFHIRSWENHGTAVFLPLGTAAVVGTSQPYGANSGSISSVDVPSAFLTFRLHGVGDLALSWHDPATNYVKRTVLTGDIISGGGGYGGHGGY